ncbi:uncharacterized protein LOC128990771 [Macrosteles quadrilineatus]|uniref:uncharacterized protein LOC128990771 n=1 Tax=Macrosteles quadrilineatus TaxID=74068 RepID=UPI0023E2B93F|nr:uncharacterized protein LOC128990771 [Macrosteles quadrilineatus]
MEDGQDSGSDQTSDSNIVDKGWSIISHNTELLFFTTLGIVEILAEAAGYRPFIRLNNLLPPVPDYGEGGSNATLANTSDQGDLTDLALIYQISRVVDVVGAYTVHLSLATHILLPYPVITERQNILLVPWLVVTLLRSVVRELVISLVGIVLCASHNVFYYPCVQYSALQGAQFCFTFYFWSSMHNFYHFLQNKHSTEGRVASVIHSINTNLLNSEPLSQRSLDRVLSVTLDEDEENTEAMLVERAAMAWITREILENDREYVTDRQFSEYLVVKATIELKQALKELAEKKLTKKKKLNTKQKLKASLQIMGLSSKESLGDSMTEAFESSRTLSKRDPIRNIRPLFSRGKPVSPDASVISGLSDITVASGTSVDSEAQTEPPTREMSKLLDMLENQ